MASESTINKDYKTADQTERRSRIGVTRLHIFLLLTAIIIPGAFLALTSNEAEAIRVDAGSAANPESEIRPLALPAPDQGPATGTSASSVPAIPDINALQEKTVTIKKGDTLSGIFTDLALDQNHLFNILESGKEAATLKHLLPGNQLLFRIGTNNQIQQLVYKIDTTSSLHITNNDDAYSAHVLVKTPERYITQASGAITSSLFLAGQAAGLSDDLIMELANIFAWDVDFALDIRENDRFSVIYEELYLDGEKIGNGHILAADFTNQGRAYRALRYTDPEGGSDYFTPEGNSLRKAFLRSPVDFRRVSSGFQGERYHPILGTKRPHRGVDYAAAVGTPIKAAGDGKILFKGTKGGYGRTIIVQHGTQYSTLYGHLSGYARGITPGKPVRQGQTIGYVGMSGLATGPHLHYEFLVNGIHRNPLTVKLPNALPISEKFLADFKQKSRSMIVMLDMLENALLAENTF